MAGKSIHHSVVNTSLIQDAVLETQEFSEYLLLPDGVKALITQVVKLFWSMKMRNSPNCK
jgi:hypothetical protein